MSQAPLHVIDSHTEGEPTRVVVSGGPDLGNGTDGGKGETPARRSRLAAQRRLQRTARPRGDGRCLALRTPRAGLRLRRDFFQQPLDAQHVHPRHHRPDRDTCASGQNRRRLAPHRHARRRGRRHSARGWLGGSRECPELPQEPRTCPSRFPAGAPCAATSHGAETGFSSSRTKARAVDFANLEALTDFTWQVRQELGKQGITGDDGMEIDHIEVFGPPARSRSGRQPELRALPGKSLRPLALRHRHQRQARLPPRRRQTQARRNLAPGRHPRHRLPRHASKNCPMAKSSPASPAAPG